MAIDICLVGFGAIGAIYAYALEKSNGARVTAVCRSNYHTLRDDGLEIISHKFGSTQGWKPFRIVKTVDEAADRHYPFVICATKCVPEVIKTSEILAPLISPLLSSNTVFLLIQNGVGIEDDLREALQSRGFTNTIMSACAWVDVTMVDAGRKVTQYGTERLTIGYHQPHADSAQAALDQITKLLSEGGCTPEPVGGDIDVARWRKVLWNASFSTLCTLSRCTVGELLRVESGRKALEDIIAEVLVVARANLPHQAALSLPDIVIREIIDHESPESTFKPSMLVDLEAGRPMEIEAIQGGVLKRARAAGVPAPRLEVLYAGLCVVQKVLLDARS